MNNNIDGVSRDTAGFFLLRALGKKSLPTNRRVDPNCAEAKEKRCRRRGGEVLRTKRSQ